MGVDLADYEKKAPKAVKAFWTNRRGAKSKQISSGRTDQGERSGVTAGKNMNGFLDLVKDIVQLNGLATAEICLSRQVLSLPGYFRPTKVWDMLILAESRIVATIEFKSQVGPSFGNNFNNRTEEAIGAAVDFWTAYREGAFGISPRPFVGWLILVGDCLGSRSQVRTTSPHFPLLAEFECASYAERYEVLCRKLFQEQLYTTASVILSSRSAIRTGNFTELSDMTSLKTIVTTLAGHVAATAAQL